MDTQQALFTTCKENFEAQCNLMASLSQTAFTGLAKLVELNMSTAQAHLSKSAVATKQYLSADSKEWLSLSVAQYQPAAEKAFGYMRNASTIVSETQAELKKTAEAEIAENSSKIMSVFEAAKNAPAGLANTLAHLKDQTGKAAPKSSLAAAA